MRDPACEFTQPKTHLFDHLCNIREASLTFGFVLLDAVEDVFERVVVLAACIAAVFSDCVEERGQNRRLLIWGQKRSMKTNHTEKAL